MAQRKLNFYWYKCLYHQNVPKGDWFCPECKIKQTPRSPNKKGKKRKAFTEEEEVVEEPQEPEEEMEQEEEL